MIVLACGRYIVTSSWFGFDAIAVLQTYLFELKCEFAHNPIVKDNKLRLQVTYQQGIMKQILDRCC
jgi:hypothetical protein